MKETTLVLLIISIISVSSATRVPINSHDDQRTPFDLEIKSLAFESTDKGYRIKKLLEASKNRINIL